MGFVEPAHVQRTQAYILFRAFDFFFFTFFVVLFAENQQMNQMKPKQKNLWKKTPNSDDSFIFDGKFPKRHLREPLEENKAEEEQE